MFPGALGISEFKFRVTFGPELLPANWETGAGVCRGEGKRPQGLEAATPMGFFLSIASWRYRWKLGSPVGYMGTTLQTEAMVSTCLHLSLLLSRGCWVILKKARSPTPRLVVLGILAGCWKLGFTQLLIAKGLYWVGAGVKACPSRV